MLAALRRWWRPTRGEGRIVSETGTIPREGGGFTKIRDQLCRCGGAEPIAFFDFNGNQSKRNIFLARMTAVSENKVTAPIDDRRVFDRRGRYRVLADKAQGMELRSLAQETLAVEDEEVHKCAGECFAGLDSPVRVIFDLLETGFWELFQLAMSLSSAE